MNKKETGDNHHGPSHHASGGLKDNKNEYGTESKIPVCQITPSENILFDIIEGINLYEYNKQDDDHIYGEPGIQRTFPGFSA